MQHDQFALDGVGVDRAPVLSLVVPSDVPDLEIPFLDQWSDDAESCVVDHSTLFVRQRNRVVVEPGHLQYRHTYTWGRLRRSGPQKYSAKFTCGRRSRISRLNIDAYYFFDYRLH